IRTPPSPSYFFFLLLRPPPTSTLFPYTTLFRSRSAHDGAGDRDPLTLPAGESHAAVADDRVVPVGELRDEGVGVGDLGGPDDLGVREPVAPVGDVLPDRGMEQQRLLRDDAEESTVGRLPERPQIAAV